MVAAGVGSALTLAIYRGQRRIKLWFNTAKTIIEVELALVLFHALVTGPIVPHAGVFLAAGAAVVVASLVGGALVTLVIALSEGRWTTAALRDILGLGLVGTFVAVSLGLLSVVIARADPWALACSSRPPPDRSGSIPRSGRNDTEWRACSSCTSRRGCCTSRPRSTTRSWRS